MIVAVPPDIREDALAHPARTDELHRLTGETMGTTWTAAFYAPPSVSVERIHRRITCDLDLLVGQMSHYRGDSCLSRYNAAPAGVWLPLPPEFFRVLHFSLQVARESSGAFSPTLGDAVNAWGFGPAGPRTHPPASGEPEGEAAAWRRIELDPLNQRALQPGGASLNLSAVAKGFAVDHICASLDALEIRSYLFEIGGEFRARGVKADFQPWWVAVEPPPGYRGVVRAALSGFSMATSGDYHRYFEHDGIRYGHTLHPRTSRPLTNPPSSVSVIAPDCMAADAWSTALMVQGVDGGLQLAERLGIRVLFLRRDGGQWSEHWSSAFASMLE